MIALPPVPPELLYLLGHWALLSALIAGTISGFLGALDSLLGRHDR